MLTPAEGLILWIGIAALAGAFLLWAYRDADTGKTPESTCAECGHLLREHASGWPRDTGCSSGRPAKNREGKLVIFGSMDWCTCKKFMRT